MSITCIGSTSDIGNLDLHNLHVQKFVAYTQILSFNEKVNSTNEHSYSVYRDFGFSFRKWQLSKNLCWI